MAQCTYQCMSWMAEAPIPNRITTSMRGFLQPAWAGEPVTARGAGCLVCKVPESRLAAELALVLVRHVELVPDQWV